MAVQERLCGNVAAHSVWSVPIDARYCVLGRVPIDAPLTQTHVQPTISRERTTHQRDVFAV